MPDWSNAPDWAFFHLTTKLGAKFWLEYPPKEADTPSGYEYRGGKVEFDGQMPMIGPEVEVRQ